MRRQVGSVSDMTLAQSEEILRKGLRNHPVSRSPIRRDVTRPKSPKFHKIHTRELPKSTDEKEKEIMDYYKAHPFKARPVPGVGRAPPPHARLTRSVELNIDKARIDSAAAAAKRQSSSHPATFNARPLPKTTKSKSSPGLAPATPRGSNRHSSPNAKATSPAPASPPALAAEENLDIVPADGAENNPQESSNRQTAPKEELLPKTPMDDSTLQSSESAVVSGFADS